MMSEIVNCETDFKPAYFIFRLGFQKILAMPMPIAIGIGGEGAARERSVLRLRRIKILW